MFTSDSFFIWQKFQWLRYKSSQGNLCMEGHLKLRLQSHESAFYQVNVLLIVYLIVVVFLILVLELYYLKIHSDVKLLFNHSL